MTGQLPGPESGHAPHDVPADDVPGHPKEAPPMQTSPSTTRSSTSEHARPAVARRGAVDLALVATVLGGVLMAATSHPSSLGRAAGLVLAVLAVTRLVYLQVVRQQDSSPR